MRWQAVLASILLPFACAANAQRNQTSDDTILARAVLVDRSDRIELYGDGVEVEKDFIGIVDRLYIAIGAQLDRKFDEGTLGTRIKVVVSSSVRMSHVWRGYRHMSDPRAVIFLNPRAYHGARSGSNATLAHELTHLFTWRYTSHSLREGLADFVARAVMPGASVGPNGPNVEPVRVAWALTYLGSDQPAPSELTTDPEFRRLYYLSSYLLVKALIERTSMRTFLQFYDSPYSEASFESVFGIGRRHLICELALSLECGG
jgi:hypothetical protein